MGNQFKMKSEIRCGWWSGQSPLLTLKVLCTNPTPSLQIPFASYIFERGELIKIGNLGMFWPISPDDTHVRKSKLSQFPLHKRRCMIQLTQLFLTVSHHNVVKYKVACHQYFAPSIHSDLYHTQLVLQWVAHPHNRCHRGLLRRIVA